MSKLYDFYKLCKLENPDKIILIKSGMFYVILENDALYVNEFLGLKLTPLNEKISKCGFPIISLPKYEKMLQASHLDYLITSLEESNYTENDVKKKIIEEIRLLNIEALSPLSALNLLKSYQEKLNESTKTISKGESL